VPHREKSDGYVPRSIAHRNRAHSTTDSSRGTNGVSTSCYETELIESPFMPPWPFRSPEVLHRGQSRLVIVDVQEKLVPAIANYTSVVAGARFLAEGARLFGVPTHITEQYPQGLGPTVSELVEFGPVEPAKQLFSGVEALGWPPASEITDNRHQIVLAGIEAHVCVLQTAFDLLAMGYSVFLPVDALGSRSMLDRETALGRLRDSGAVITTVEAVLFEWCETAAAPEFKSLSAMLKQRKP
jgi:nicotinamidase-related amidase